MKRAVSPAVGLIVAWLGGCAGPPEPAGPSPSGQGAVNRREQLWRLTPPQTTPPVPDTRPADAPATFEQPYRLNRRNIVFLVHQLSPLVAAAREEMAAAQHALTEFRANLSRFEPFAKAAGDATEFPKRRQSTGTSGELVGGLEKETFEGAILRVEGGWSGSRVEFGEVDEGQEEVEEGSGGLVRARVEIPFAGSRKRQSRVISQAFQESSARQAVLSYLTRYRTEVAQSLSYYESALLYWNYATAYRDKVQRLRALLDEPGLKAADRLRVQSELGETEVLIEEYEASYRSSLLLLLENLGIGPEDRYVLEEDEDVPSHYLDTARTREGHARLLEQAYANNPKFEVLRDAIRNARIQRELAKAGDFDITAFFQGTQFAFGSETFDDRVGGWQLGAGVTVRLNDRRVLTATRKKAEAQIREFEADIDAEELSLRSDIATQTDRLCSYHDSRPTILENRAQLMNELDSRAKAYLTGADPPLKIDDVLRSLDGLLVSEVRLAANTYYVGRAENALMTATGEVYRMVGLSFETDDEA